MNQQYGRYILKDEIGAGGFATVFKAMDTTLEREVAIKVMRPLLMSDPEFVKRFQREATVAASLQHPNIIPIYDYGEHNGRMFTVMKLMHGSLVTRLAQGLIPWEQVVALMQQAAAGLDFAHQKGMIHRDIKPDNILFDEHGTVVLADFGIVKAMEQSTITVSMSGGILGTPAYIAPEVWNDQPITSSVDVYALACVLFEMTTGQKLFEASTPPATMALHFQALELPSQWPEGVPPGLSDVLRHALAQDPSERFQTAGELATALTTLILDPLADRYAALQAALAAETWLDAIALAEDILAQDPTYKDTPTLLQQATTGQMAAQQAIQATQWQEQAEQAIAAENWPMALTAIQRWQQINPDDPTAQQLLDKVNAAQTPPPPPAQIQATPKAKSLPSEPPKENSGIPVWVWAIAGIAIIGLLVFGGSQLLGNSNEPQIISHTAIPPAIAVVDTNTPTNMPSPLSTNTSTPQPTETQTQTTTSRPTNTYEPTVTNTPTPRPTNTPIPTATDTSTPRPTNTPEPIPTKTLIPPTEPPPGPSSTLDVLQNNGVVAISYLQACSDACVIISEGQTYPRKYLDSGYWIFEVTNVSGSQLAIEAIFMNVGGVPILNCGTAELQPGDFLTCQASGSELQAGLTSYQPNDGTIRFGISPEVQYSSGKSFTPYVIFFQ